MELFLLSGLIKDNIINSETAYLYIVHNTILHLHVH